jgi:hypothetical protein
VVALCKSAVGCSLAQDVPFFVLATILLIRTVDRKDDAAMQAPNRFCSVEYDTGSYKFLVLNTMKTAAMLATKLVKLKLLPSIWSKRKGLRAEKEKMAQSLAGLEHVEDQLEMAELAATAPADDDASVDSSQDAAPTDGGADACSAHPAAVLDDAVAGDSGSNYTVSLSLQVTECA